MARGTVPLPGSRRPRLPLGSRTCAQGDSDAMAPIRLKSSSGWAAAAASAAAFLDSGGTMTPPGGTLGPEPTR